MCRGSLESLETKQVVQCQHLAQHHQECCCLQGWHSPRAWSNIHLSSFCFPWLKRVQRCTQLPKSPQTPPPSAAWAGRARRLPCEHLLGQVCVPTPILHPFLGHTGSQPCICCSQHQPREEAPLNNAKKHFIYQNYIKILQRLSHHASAHSSRPWGRLVELTQQHQLGGQQHLTVAKVAPPGTAGQPGGLQGHVPEELGTAQPGQQRWHQAGIPSGTPLWGEQTNSISTAIVGQHCPAPASVWDHGIIQEKPIKIKSKYSKHCQDCGQPTTSTQLLNPSRDGNTTALGSPALPRSSLTHHIHTAFKPLQGWGHHCPAQPQPSVQPGIHRRDSGRRRLFPSPARTHLV